jgi:hypothetical protein
MSHTVDKPDMGYTTGFYDGQRAERERIIKLLDSNDAWIAIDAQSVGEKENTIQNLIALIKGENK